jgi:hypothetical protein
MQITQSYARPSAASERGGNLSFELSTEAARPGVQLSAVVREPLAYARAMLALHRVVGSDHCFHEKDHAAYQEWVQARYIEMLDEVAGDRLRALPEQQKELAELRGRIEPLRKRERQLLSQYEGDDLWAAKRRYWKYLYGANLALWVLLDPVVSVHPDGVIFEVFSLDESSYGRVTVPMEKLDTLGETIFGTTNVDFSQRLADELKRVRSYRPAMLEVGSGGVSIGTSAGAQFEKKIDLPPSWVRGFLQVQSAVGLPGEHVTLSASTVAEVLAALKEKREKASPRSIRFRLVPGQTPVLVLDPWDIEIREPHIVWNGSEEQEIRIWGRRRLMVVDELLPFAERVEVKLLGTGMPSYWSVEQTRGAGAGHRFELGLSGWTLNDWSASARFDLLSSLKDVSPGDVELAASQLEKSLRLSPEELASRSDLSREAAGAALQQLCREGRAMFEPGGFQRDGGFYRWRQLLAFPAPKGEEDGRLASARQWIRDSNVKCKEVTGAKDLSEFLARFVEKGVRMYEGKVKTSGGSFAPTVGLDADGRAAFAQCDCGFFRTNKLRRGPCSHILALSVVAASKPSGGALSEEKPDRFAGQTWVFTGTLSSGTREEAERAVVSGGGSATGSVSRNTTFLVAGAKAGSKLLKAKVLGVPVLNEQQWQQVLAGADPREVLAKPSSCKPSS